MSVVKLIVIAAIVLGGLAIIVPVLALFIILTLCERPSNNPPTKSEWKVD